MQMTTNSPIDQQHEVVPQQAEHQTPATTTLLGVIGMALRRNCRFKVQYNSQQSDLINLLLFE
jgi:nitrate reductase gamma subunit